MKTSAAFALIGKLLVLLGAGSLYPLGDSIYSLLALLGLGGLALLTLRSERWRMPEQTAS